MKFITTTLIALFFAINTYAQRFQFSELIKFYTLAEGSASLTPINNLLKQDASNWVGPKAVKDGTERQYYWSYSFDGSTRGALRILKDDDPILPVRLVFHFPYKLQYDNYLSYLSANMQLSNVSTDDGRQSRAYESSNFEVILSIYPPESKIYYNEGRPAPYYEIFIQRKFKR